ncbi:MAG: hypothetical protein PHQ35_03770 [Phycisphaerae bacterium]|nr:hypothetical protein [Phycisphaerae bacterium]MDD5380589.1 hypothetical protein [Phycisphaerae bacterium]
MAGDKKTKDKRISFKLGTSKRKKYRTYRPNLTGVLKIFGVLCVFAAAGVSVYFADKYIKSARPAGTGTLELVNVPQWASSELKVKIRDAAGGKIFRLDEEAAEIVAENLASIAWLDDIKIQTTHKQVLVKARWRKPMAVVKSGSQNFYVDDELVVLDFVPMPGLPLVKIEGLSSRVPSLGEIWQSDDLDAAVTILTKLDQMDKSVTPGKPLLYEIDRIDVSNFNGRKNSRLPHIVLYAKDNTEIIWGAEFGTWQRYLETTDEEKLAKLYTYFKEYGSLSGGVKYINLRDPQDNIPQPADKY